MNDRAHKVNSKIDSNLCPLQALSVKLNLTKSNWITINVKEVKKFKFGLCIVNFDALVEFLRKACDQSIIVYLYLNLMLFNINNCNTVFS